MAFSVAIRGFLGMNRDVPPGLLVPPVQGELPRLVAAAGMPAYDTVNLDPSERPGLRPRPVWRHVASPVGNAFPWGQA